MWIRYLLFACVPPGVAGVYVGYWFEGWPWLLSFVVKNVMAFGEVGADVNGQRCPVRCHGAFVDITVSPQRCGRIYITAEPANAGERRCRDIARHSNLLECYRQGN